MLTTEQLAAHWEQSSPEVILKRTKTLVRHVDNGVIAFADLVVLASALSVANANNILSVNLPWEA